MERLTKTELRALLEFIKECYPICDTETFAQRVVSRLSKIVPKEMILHNGVNPRRRNACATYPRHASNSSARRIFTQRARASPCHPSTTEAPHYARAISPVEAIEKDLSPVKGELPAGHRDRRSPPTQKQVAVNAKDLADRDQFLVLLRFHLMQAYRNAEKVTE